MKREIKFRAQTKNLDWVYGHYFHTQRFVNGDSCQDVWLIRDDCDQDYYVDNNTVGQFTGRKDENGKEVYEGDIVEFWGGVGIIEFTNGSFRINYEDYNYFLIPDNYEVIGNIHENPELLK